MFDFIQQYEKAVV